MKRTLSADIIVFFFIFLFVYTGVTKLFDIQTIKEQLVSAPLVPSAFAGILAWTLPIVELFVAFVLMIPAWRLKGLYLTLLLMSFFTVYVIIVLSIDSELSCSCGGIIEELSPEQHVIFNLACVILGLLAILVLRKKQPTIRFRWLTGTSSLALLLIDGWILGSAFTAPIVFKTGMEGRSLPSFDVQLVDSVTRLNTANIPKGKPFIIIGFSPWCKHCQEETRDIITHIRDFKNCRIYFFTPMPFADMRTYYRYFKLSRYPNIIMGRDINNTFFPYFKAWGTPYTAVFDQQKKVENGSASSQGRSIGRASITIELSIL